MESRLSHAPRQSVPFERSFKGVPTSPLLAFCAPDQTDDSRREEAVFKRLVFGESGLSSPQMKTSNSTESGREMGPGEREKAWQRVLLRLSDHFVEAALQRPHLSSVLFEILDDAYEFLFLFGRESDIEALEWWLDWPQKRE